VIGATRAQSDELARKSHDAKQLMAAGRFADAIPLYQELCRALPANTGLRLNLGLAYHMAGRQAEAVPELERVLKSDPANQPALLSLGVALLDLNQPEKAVGPLEKVVAVQTSNVEARGMLANALLSLGRSRDAAVQFRTLSASTPRDPKPWYGLGRSYEALARAAFDELNKTAQGSAEWLVLVADSRLQRRQYRSAFYFYTEALRKRPDFRGLHLALAEVYRRTEHLDWASIEERKERSMGPPDCTREKPACSFAASRFLEAASGTDPYWRARAYNELALRAFAHLESLPESVELHALKAEVLAGHGDHLEAAAEWRAAQKLKPDDPVIARQLATAMYLAHDYRPALPMLQEFARQEPRSAELHFFVGDSLLHLEDVPRAIPELATAVRLDPKLLPAHASLGLAYARTGKPAEAIPHLSAALDLDEDGSLHYQLARAYQQTGQADRAQAAMQQYQDFRRRSDAEAKELEQTVKITAPEPPR
jgi:predicted Zn-dependent protease